MNLRNVSTLSGGRGYQLLRVSTTGSAVHFDDNFDACTSTTDLGPSWDITSVWYCKAQRARGAQGPGMALPRVSDLGDTDVRALVHLNASSGSGLVAPAAHDSYYALRLNIVGSIDLVRVIGGQTTTLASLATTVADVTSYRLRLVITGTSRVILDACRNDVAVLHASDSSASRLTVRPAARGSSRAPAIAPSTTTSRSTAPPPEHLLRRRRPPASATTSMPAPQPLISGRAGRSSAAGTAARNTRAGRPQTGSPS